MEATFVAHLFIKCIFWSNKLKLLTPLLSSQTGWYKSYYNAIYLADFKIVGRCWYDGTFRFIILGIFTHVFIKSDTWHWSNITCVSKCIHQDILRIIELYCHWYWAKIVHDIIMIVYTAIRIERHPLWINKKVFMLT